MSSDTLDRTLTPDAVVTSEVPPVMLVTLNVPYDEAAVEFAIETAASTGAELWVCDAIPLGFENYAGHAAEAAA